MKKMLTISAALVCGAVMAIESANVVGYNTLTTDGTKSPTIGLSFLPVTGTQAKLGDFIPENGTMSPDDDMLQVIDSTSLNAINLFVYCDKATADFIAEDNGEAAGSYDELIGWWDGFAGIGEDDAAMNGFPVNPGFGFMGYFESGNIIKFISSGSAPTKATSITTDGTKSPTIINYVPKTLTLGNIVPVDGTMSPDDDMLQLIDSTSLNAVKLYIYCDKTTADFIAEDNGEAAGSYDELIGWWDGFAGIGEDDASYNDEEVPAGTGFMGYFESGNEITFQFPSAL